MKKVFFSEFFTLTNYRGIPFTGVLNEKYSLALVSEFFTLTNDITGV